MKIFYLPDLGEGLPDAEIREWYVKVGDEVTTDQPLVSMETAKAILDVPSPFSGKVVALHGKDGDIIKTGRPLVSFSGDDPHEDAGTVVGHLTSHEGILEEQMKVIKRQGTTHISNAPTIVKQLAARLGVDLKTITGTGPRGMITANDVKTASAPLAMPEGYTPIKGSRRMMLASMTLARDTVSQVTIVDDADLSAWSNDEDISARMVRALVTAAAAEPMLNASFDAHTQSYQLHQTVHVGIAMDTEEGLFVPVIHDAQTLGQKAIRERINALKKSVHERSIPPNELHGATITLSNFGKFAGRYATALVVPPQLAIIATGVKRLDAIVKNNALCVAPRLPLSLSFDHRAVTGGEAARFMGALIQDLEKEK